MSAIVAKAQRWATRFIREGIDTEGKFIASAAYELKGSDLRKALVHAFMTGHGVAAADKVSPIARSRGFSSVEEPGRPGQSSRRERHRNSTPGDKLAGSPARLMRRLRDRGGKFYEDLNKTH